VSATDLTARRRAREDLGRRAEAKCVWLLRLRGYRILGRRVRTPRGELDIVARRGRTVAFIEVKARSSIPVAAEAVSPRQRRRIEQAARWFVAARPHLADSSLRFDAMFVVPGRLPVHVTNAWQPGEGNR
jgi:putative endonuclease